MTRNVPLLRWVSLLALPAFAQSPNTAALVVEVFDQNGGAVPDARITIVNSTTGATREATSGPGGSTTVGALPVAGTYRVTVAKPGFTAEDVRDVVLRAGEDNNGDGVDTDRPMIEGAVVGRNAFRGSSTSDVALFAEGRVRATHGTITIRAEVFNLFNHANVLGRNGVYGNGAAPGAGLGAPLAGLASVEPARMMQLLARYSF